MPMPAGVVSTDDFEAEIERQVEILDAMFSDPGLEALRAKTPLHPAVIRRDALASFLPRRMRPPNELMALAAQLGLNAIDRMLWMHDPDGGDYWRFLPSPASADRVRQNLHDPSNFDETLAEVRVWSYLRNQGLAADLVEEEGLPDIPVNRRSADEVWVEVKYVHETTSPKGLLKRLNKANSQIRTASLNGSGVACVYLERNLVPRELSADAAAAERARLPSGEDPPPKDVEERLSTIEAAMNRADRYRSLAATIVTWEDHAFVGEWPRLTYIVRRQAVIRRHVAPRVSLPVAAESFVVGGWAAFGLGTHSVR